MSYDILLKILEMSSLQEGENLRENWIVVFKYLKDN